MTTPADEPGSNGYATKLWTTNLVNDSQGKQWDAIRTNTTAISVLNAKLGWILALFVPVLLLLVGIYIK